MVATAVLCALFSSPCIPVNPPRHSAFIRRGRCPNFLSPGFLFSLPCSSWPAPWKRLPVSHPWAPTLPSCRPLVHSAPFHLVLTCFFPQGTHSIHTALPTLPHLLQPLPLSRPPASLRPSSPSPFRLLDPDDLMSMAAPLQTPLPLPTPLPQPLGPQEPPLLPKL